MFVRHKLDFYVYYCYQILHFCLILINTGQVFLCLLLSVCLCLRLSLFLAHILDTHTYTYICWYTFTNPSVVQSAGALDYTDCFSAGVLAPPTNKYPGYDTKQFNNDFPVKLELWRIQSTPSLISLPGPLWPGVVKPERVLSLSQIELICLLCCTESLIYLFYSYVRVCF